MTPVTRHIPLTFVNQPARLIQHPAGNEQPVCDASGIRNLDAIAGRRRCHRVAAWGVSIIIALAAVLCFVIGCGIAHAQLAPGPFNPPVHAAPAAPDVARVPGGPGGDNSIPEPEPWRLALVGVTDGGVALYLRRFAGINQPTKEQK